MLEHEVANIRFGGLIVVLLYGCGVWSMQHVLCNVFNSDRIDCFKMRGSVSLLKLWEVRILSFCVLGKAIACRVSACACTFVIVELEDFDWYGNSLSQVWNHRLVFLCWGKMLYSFFASLDSKFITWTSFGMQWNSEKTEWDNEAFCNNLCWSCIWLLYGSVISNTHINQGAKAFCLYGCVSPPFHSNDFN